MSAVARAAMVWLCGPPWRPGKTAKLILEGGHVGVRKTDDGLGTLNTGEMNAPRVKPKVH